MDMKHHLLSALREQLDQWEALLSSLSDPQLSAPLAPSHWTVKDVVTHVMAWQQRSIARFDAALQGRDPVYPDWPVKDDPEDAGETTTDRVNAAIYGLYKDQPWAKVRQDWQAGFERLLSLAESIPERDLLDTSRYPWMHGYALADVLLGTYDHHQEHIEKLRAWLSDH